MKDNITAGVVIGIHWSFKGSTQNMGGMFSVANAQRMGFTMAQIEAAWKAGGWLTLDDPSRLLGQ